ncbi:hypothetical protein M3Y97_00915800 [Aphelenchoides bicaudatus]|nr:hypothetical protein M3Y97_00915800 [Aphelenchoides bicaudatus]
MNFPKVLNNQYVLGANIINEKIPGYPLFDVLEPKIFLKNICGFTLYNLFHDQQKEIVIDFELQKIVRGQKPFVVQINSELMILIQNWQLNRDADRLFNINLLKFNFEEFRIERLDTCTVTGMFEYFIVDQKNLNEFLFIYEPARLEKVVG